MSDTTRNELRREVLAYVKDNAPVSVRAMTDALGSKHSLDDVRKVVQPMIVTGKLSYASGLKIKLGNATK